MPIMQIDSICATREATHDAALGNAGSGNSLGQGQ